MANFQSLSKITSSVVSGTQIQYQVALAALGCAEDHRADLVADLGEPPIFVAIVTVNHHG